MIKDNKKFIVIITSIMVGINILGAIFTFIFDNKNMLPIFNVIGTVVFLLYLGVRASITEHIKYTDELNGKKDEEKYKNRKTTQKLGWLLFVVQAIITVTVCSIFL
ncbi:MAG: hypothetical protein IKP77_01540 [Acholeplasmatales bacterium]|nr:hypothetical protein [Acholeplasmatales bacterium]